MTRPVLSARLPIVLAAAMVPLLSPFALAGGAEPTPGGALPPEQPTTAQEEVPELDTSKIWPCVQRRVDTISVIQVWDGPSIEGLKGWYTNKELVDLVDVLASRRIPVDEAQAAIKTYSDKQPADQRDQALTMLFAALFDKVSSQRRLVVAGIEKYQKSQIARSKELERQSTLIAELEKKAAAKGGDAGGAPEAGADGAAAPSAGDAATPSPQGETTAAGEIIPDTGNVASGLPELDQAREHFNWAQRIFQERQQSMPLACELPGLIDERLYALAHAIRGLMKS